MKRNKKTLEDLKNSTLIPVMLVPERIPVSLATVRAWIFQGKLPVIRIGRKVLFGRRYLRRLKWEDLKPFLVNKIFAPPH